MEITIIKLILEHVTALFICGVEVWSAIKYFKNNRYISFGFSFSIAILMFIMAIRTVFLFT